MPRPSLRPPTDSMQQVDSVPGRSDALGHFPWRRAEREGLAVSAARGSSCQCVFPTESESVHRRLVSVDPEGGRLASLASRSHGVLAVQTLAPADVRSASRALARVWTAALRHALSRVRAIRPHSYEESIMGGRSGGRRKLSDAQVAAILEWHRNRRTRAELARELGVAAHLIGSAIWRRGYYKSASPENRERNLHERRARIASLMARTLL